MRAADEALVAQLLAKWEADAAADAANAAKRAELAQQHKAEVARQQQLKREAFEAAKAT